MESSTRQRRSKKAIISKKEKSLKDDTDAKLNKAMSQLILSKAQSLELHSQWRTYLLRLNVLALILSLLQVYKPISSCVGIPSFIEENGTDAMTRWDKIVTNFKGETAVRFLLKFSSEIVGFFVLIFLPCYIHWEKQFWINSSPEMSNPRVFAHWTYTLSSALCGLSIILFTFNKTNSGKEAATSVFEECIGTQKRDFPVSDLYFLICSGACWFMNYSMSKTDVHINLINELRTSVNSARKAVCEKREFINSMGSEE